MRQIVVKYSGNCAKCGHSLEVGSSAMYEKSMGIFCCGCEPTDIEDIRHYRTIKAEGKADRLLARADRLDSEATRKAAPLEAMRGDIAFFTQPGRIPYRDRIFRSYDKAGELAQEARQARERADGMTITGYLAYVKRHEEHIFVREMVGRAWLSVSLSSLPPKRWAYHVGRMAEAGMLPTYVKRP